MLNNKTRYVILKYSIIIILLNDYSQKRNSVNWIAL